MDTLKIIQRKVREAQGERTHRSFAKRLGISIGSLSRIKNSPQNATLRTILKICHTLHVTPSQFLDETDTHHRR
jgi:transcriptional regulator with XRE-family HTH domain